MKAYKGFNTDMTCRGFQYEEGKTYTEEKADLCNSGFHACEMPLDVFKFYAPAGSVFHEVELDEVSDQRESDDSKICGKVIKIGAKLDIAGLCKAQFEYVKANCNNEHTDPKQATAGEYGAATAGFRGAATAGDSGAATAGEYGAATAGDSGAATAGEYGAATAGDSGAATAGFRGAATSKGTAAVGKEGAALARGNNVKVKGGLGAVLVAVEENDTDYGIKSWCAAVVDGEKIKPDVWYKCENGTFVEVV